MSITIKHLSLVVVASVISGALVALFVGVLGTFADPNTPAPQISERPGGFDPIPEFEATRAELEFRGVECARVMAGVNYRLSRRCTGDVSE